MVNAVFVGLDNAGKTSIRLFLQSLDKEGALRTRASTSIERLARAGLTISIIPGQKYYRENERFYRILFPSADHIVFVVDSSRPDRFTEARKYYQYVKRMIRKYSLKKPKITILAHKQDIRGALPGSDVKKAIAGARSKVLVLETSIHDMMSMIILLKNLYGGLKGNDIDFVTQALQERLMADAIAIYDSQRLPLSTSGSEDLVRKTYDRYFSSLVKDGDFRFSIISTNGTKAAMVCENVNGYSVLVLSVGFNVGIEEALSIIREAALCYAKEFSKRWGTDNPWGI